MKWGPAGEGICVEEGVVSGARAIKVPPAHGPCRACFVHLGQGLALELSAGPEPLPERLHFSAGGVQVRNGGGWGPPASAMCPPPRLSPSASSRRALRHSTSCPGRTMQRFASARTTPPRSRGRVGSGQPHLVGTVPLPKTRPRRVWRGEMEKRPACPARSGPPLRQRKAPTQSQTCRAPWPPRALPWLTRATC